MGRDVLETREKGHNYTNSEWLLMLLTKHHVILVLLLLMIFCHLLILDLISLSSL
jgi:hypothetical protein